MFDRTNTFIPVVTQLISIFDKNVKTQNKVLCVGRAMFWIQFYFKLPQHSVTNTKTVHGLKIIAVKDILQIQKSSFFFILRLILKTAGNSGMQGSRVHYALYDMRYCPTEPLKRTVRTLPCLSYAHFLFIV